MSFFDGTNQGTGIWSILEDGENTAEQVSNITFRNVGSALEILFDIELDNIVFFFGKIVTFYKANRGN